MGFEGIQRHGQQWLRAVVACGLLAAGCGGAEHDPVAPASRQDWPGHGQARQDEPGDRVAAWVGGDSRRMVRRNVRAAARLLVLPQHGPSRPITAGCVHASSLLASRAQPGTVFLIIDGALHIMDTRAAHPASTPLAITPAGVVLMQLLASSRQAPPAELLILIQSAGAPAPTLWRFVVEGPRATGSPVGNEPWLQSREAFLARFHASRCRDDGSDCLAITDGGTGALLDVQPAPRAPRQQWRALGTARVQDVSWNSGDTGSALALVTCDQQAP